MNTRITPFLDGRRAGVRYDCSFCGAPQERATELPVMAVSILQGALIAAGPLTIEVAGGAACEICAVLLKNLYHARIANGERTRDHQPAETEDGATCHDCGTVLGWEHGERWCPFCGEPRG